MAPFFSILFAGKCPRCKRGNVFPSANPFNLFKMADNHKTCSECGLDFIPEVGFYWGATYVSYALTVAFSVFTFVVSVVFFGLLKSLSIEYVVTNAILMILFLPLFYRVSRMMWLWMFYEEEQTADN